MDSPEQMNRELNLVGSGGLRIGNAGYGDGVFDAVYVRRMTM